MLIATDLARKMSLDMRMIDPMKYADHIDNKASHCAKLLSEYYRKYDEQKGTQFVFSDLGTYKPGEWNVYSEIKRKLVEDYGIPSSEIRFIQECKNEKAKKAMVEVGLTHNPNYSPSSKSCRGLSLAKNICTRGIDLPSFAFRCCRMKRSILAMSSMFMAASPARLLQPSSPR